jgi:Barrel-sandwich domain of CusB or HlyD membrane-fusion/GAF domain
MAISVAQTWLENKVADRTDVSSALLMLAQNGTLEQAAVWPRTQAADPSLWVIAKEAYRTNEAVSWANPDSSPSEAGTQTAYSGPERRKHSRLESKPLIRNGKLVGAMALLVSSDKEAPVAINDSDVLPVQPMKATEVAAVAVKERLNSKIGESKALNILQAVATVLSKDKFELAIAEVATELAIAFECDRVSIGLIKGRFNEVLAVSHSADIQPTPSLLQLLAAAMDEAVDQFATVQYPPLPGALHQITLSHAELANRHNTQQMLTVAMMRDQTIIGAMLFERRDLVPFNQETIDLLEHLAATVGPVLELKRDREYSWFSRLKTDITRCFHKMLSREGRWLRLAIGTAVVTMLALPMVPMQYSLNAPARLEGISQRVMVAATDGFLRSVSVRPGDLVKKGQVLAEMADEDLRQERRRWESEVLRHDSTFGDALKRRDRSQMATAQALAAEARAQLNLAEQQIERTRLIAPFNGVVLKGDLKQQIGAPFKRGDTLLVLAPANEFRVMVSVEDRAIDTVKKGAIGQLLLSSMPDTPVSIRVERILPVANATDGRNAFEVEARIIEQSDDPSGALRPGMEGVAKIQAGDRSLYWMFGHRLLDSFKLWFWSWTH